MMIHPTHKLNLYQTLAALPATSNYTLLPSLTPTTTMATIINKSPSLPFITRFKLFIFHFATTLCGKHLFDLIPSKASAPATKLINNTHVSTSDITIHPSRNLWFRLFIPNSTTLTQKLLPLIVYFHGGGFAEHGPETVFYDYLCSHLAAGVPAVVASVNYRLTPHHKYPTQYEDGLDVLKFIDAHHSQFLPSNTDLSKCFVGGDSAGGNIAHHVTVRALEKAVKYDKVKIIGILGLQPFFGGEERTESELRLTKAPILRLKDADAYWREFLPDGADRNHPAAHVFGGGDNSEAAAALVENIIDFPTTLVIVGGDDILQDWDRRYVKWLESCGKRVQLVEYPNAFHGFYAFPEMPEFAFLVKDVASFVQEQVNSN